MSLLRAMGTFHSVALAVLYSLYHAASVGSNLWLSHWTDDIQRSNFTVLPNNTYRIHDNTIYIGVYGALAVTQCEFCFSIHNKGTS